MTNKFDFIVIGAGPAGSILASRLANAATHPTVLLIEAGGDGLPEERRQPYLRYENAFVLPELERGYQTIPQLGLNGRQLLYQRGNGLGGTSMINFMVYTVGPSADWDRWAELVGDQDWNWENSQKRFRRIETLHDNVEDKLRKYINPKKSDHGYHGGLHISYPEKELESDVKITRDAGEELGWPTNPDVNSGDVMGHGITPLTSVNGVRCTSEMAFLQSSPHNLTIWTLSPVSKILFEDKTATGIETMDGKQAFAAREIILSAGSIDSPKLLLLSGIGPADELKTHGIQLVLDLPAVGKNAQDHLSVAATELMDRNFSPKFEFALDIAGQAAALDEWKETHTGPRSFLNSSNTVVFWKDDTIFETDAFKSLDEETRKFLRHPGVPTFEIITSAPFVIPNYPIREDTSYSSHFIALMNSQSTGSIRLRSRDPLDKPVIDPGYLTHPFDQHVMVSAFRAHGNLMRTKTMKKHHKGPINMPKSESDEDILAFVRENATPFWHFSSTAKMGKANDKNAVVDSEMRVFGVQNLRIADISVCPFNPNAHTQAAAYLIGQTAADKIIAEYKL